MWTYREKTIDADIVRTTFERTANISTNQLGFIVGTLDDDIYDASNSIHFFCHSNDIKLNHTFARDVSKRIKDEFNRRFFTIICTSRLQIVAVPPVESTQPILLETLNLLVYRYVFIS